MTKYIEDVLLELPHAVYARITYFIVLLNPFLQTV